VRQPVPEEARAAMQDPTTTPTPAPQPVALDGEEVLDFTPAARRRVLFRLDHDTGEVFEAAPALPTGLAVEVVALAEQLRDTPTASDGQPAAGIGQRLENFLGVFDRILKPESAARFRGRLVDVERPVDPAQLVAVLQGLMGRWGLRPTPPSPGSSPPPPGPGDGTSSPAVLPGPASVSAASPSTSS
jgi:hypothetical protein